MLFQSPSQNSKHNHIPNIDPIIENMTVINTKTTAEHKNMSSNNTSTNSDQKNKKDTAILVKHHMDNSATPDVHTLPEHTNKNNKSVTWAEQIEENISSPRKENKLKLNNRTDKRRIKLLEKYPSLPENDQIDLSPTNIAKLQKQDSHCANIINYLINYILPEDNKTAREILLKEEDFIIIDDILYHITVNTGHSQFQPVFQLYVPQNLKQYMLVLNHDSTFGGHTGKAKMLSLMKPRYYWKHMTRDIQNYVKTCPSCLATKSMPNPIKPPLLLRDRVEIPFHTVFLDSMGPFKPSKNGYVHLVVAVCYFTRYIIAWPTTNITASKMAREFHDNVATKVGFSKRICSDRGSSFIGQMFKEMCQIFGIKQSFGASYQPATQGCVERANRSILQLLRNFVDTQQKFWDMYIPSVTFALNSTVTNATNFTPFQMVYGRNVITPPEITLPDVNDENCTVSDQMSNLITGHKIASEMAAKRNEEQMQRMKKYHDRYTNENKLVLGSTVYINIPKLKVPHTRKKLQHKYAGPFVIYQFQGPTRVYLRNLDTDQYLSTPVAIQRLKMAPLRPQPAPWHPILDQIDLTQDPINDNVDDDQLLQEVTVSGNVDYDQLLPKVTGTDTTNSDIPETTSQENPSLSIDRITDRDAENTNKLIKSDGTSACFKSVRRQAMSENDKYYDIVFTDGSQEWIKHTTLSPSLLEKCIQINPPMSRMSKRMIIKPKPYSNVSH